MFLKYGLNVGLIFAVTIFFSLADQDNNQGSERFVKACYGERSIILNCDEGRAIRINTATYELLKEGSTICRHVNNTRNGCHEQQLNVKVQNVCGGKEKCSFDTETNNITSECLPSMFLSISYECTSTESKNMANSNNEKMSTNFRIIIFLMDMRSTFQFFKENPRKSVLCVILGLAFAISLLIVYLLFLAYCKRCHSKNVDMSSEVAHDEEEGVKQLLISQPYNTTISRHQQLQQQEPKTYETVLVTRENGVPLQETMISSDSTLLTRKKKGNSGGIHAEVISTIKRTHSIDEGTQTDIEEYDGQPSKQPRTLSMREARELGDLVDDMNCYNSRIDDDDAFYPDFTGSFSLDNQRRNKSTSHRPEISSFSNNNNNNSDSNKHPSREYYYANRGPSYEQSRQAVNKNRSTPDRQPLLGSNSPASIPPSRYQLRTNNNLDFTTPKQRNRSRNHSELSYTTSASESSSLGNYSPEAIFNGEPIRHGSIQRTPKPGVRGDGYEFIIHSTSPRTR